MVHQTDNIRPAGPALSYADAKADELKKKK